MPAKSKKTLSKISYSAIPIFRPAQDDQFNRFNAQISFNRGGSAYGNGYGTLALFQMPQNLNPLRYAYSSLDKEQYSLKVKWDGEQAAISNVIHLKNERLTAIAKGKYIPSESVLTPAELFLLERYLGDEKSESALFLFFIAECLNTSIKPNKKLAQLLTDENVSREALLNQQTQENSALSNAFKKSRADANAQKLKRETKAKECARIQRGLIAVENDEIKLRAGISNQAALFFQQLGSQEKKVLQIRTVLKIAADNASEVYARYNAELISLIENLNKFAMEKKLSLPAEIAFALSVFTKTFSYFLNKENNISPVFVFLIHSYADFFVKKWDATKKNSEFSDCSSSVDNMQLIPNFFQSLLTSYNYLHFFEEDKARIQKIVACYIYIESRIDKFSDTFAADALLTELLNQADTLIKLFFVETVSNIISDVHKATIPFVQVQLAYEAMLNRIEFLAKKEAPGAAIFNIPIPVIEQGRAHIQELEKFERCAADKVALRIR